ncbi:FAD-dependent oxidoreductase [Streptomyces sp. NPDC013433]|uniref:FAD-dependent oxidoreductase n=1 Tax=Streptomyces sp. NPDC013433 TaxID=3155604 RepID=UPI003451886E
MSDTPAPDRSAATSDRGPATSGRYVPVPDPDPDRSAAAPGGRPAGADRGATDVTPAPVTGDGVPGEGEQDRRTGPGGRDEGPGSGEPGGVPGSGPTGGVPGPGAAGAVTVPGVRAADGPGDPALDDVDGDFRALLDRFEGMARRARVTLRRPLHTHAVTVGGTLDFQDVPGVPRHPFFAPGLRYPVLARFSNGESPDDLIPGTRGLSLLLLHPAAPADPARSPFNLTLNTGRRLFAPDAATFARYLLGTDTDRATVAREVPGAREALWEQIRRPVPFAGHHYHSQAPRLYTDATGTPWLVRYRVVPDGESGGDPGAPADPSGPGRHDPGDRLFPPVAPEFLPREPGDRRSPRLFRDHLLARVREAGGVRLLFQVRLHPLGTDPRANRAALDPSADWPEAAFPHHTIARLTLDGVPGGDLAEQAVFDPACAPPGLGIALARSPYETASVNHARALVYRAVHAARTPRPAAPAPAPAAPVPAPVPSAGPRPGGPRRVCVIGAGPAGLTAARELEKRGHTVVVLDSAGEVGGKSASVEIDGRPYDLGAHLCTSRYGELTGLVAELGLETEDTTPTLLYDADRAAIAPPAPVPGLPEALARYRALRAERFPGISAPGLAPAAPALSRPAAGWLEDHGLTALGHWLGDACTASGYGYLDGDGHGHLDGGGDGDGHGERGPRTGGVPALYFVRHAEMTGLITPGRAATGHLGTFTVKGGFGRLWRRVAGELADVRTGVRVTRIQRSADGITVHTGDGTLSADALVLACPLDQAAALLEPDAPERALAARIRTLPYRTVLCRITGLPENGMYLVRTGGRIAPPGHCVAFHHRHPGSDVYACYAYGPDTPEAEAVLRADIEAMGGRLEEVLLTRTWRFMPHFSADDLAAGILDRLENLQGRDRTYHTGGLHGFELIENVIAHSRALVERFFGASAAPETNSGAGTGAGGASAPVPGSAAPGRAEILAWLEDHLASELGHRREEFDPHAPLASYGLDSLTSVTLLADLSREVGTALPPTLLLDLPTLDAVAAYTADLIAPASWAVTPATAGTGPATPASATPGAVAPAPVAPAPGAGAAAPGGTPVAGATDSRPALPPASPTAVPLTPAAPFFCVGGAIGSAHQLLPLADALGPGHPFYGLQAPGVDGRETPLTTVEALAERYLTAVRAVQPRGPYLLGGYSFGGLVAYETARLLRGAGHEVTAVVALDTYVPEPGQPVPGRDDRAALLEIAAVHRAMAGDDGGFRPRPELTDAQCRALAHRELAATGTPLADPTLDRLLAVYQASLAAYVRYRVPPSDLRVVLVKAAQEFPPVIGETRRPRLPVSDPTAGWGGVDLGALEVTRLPGGHFTLLRPDRVGAVADRLRVVLDGRWAVPPAGRAAIPDQRRSAP